MSEKKIVVTEIAKLANEDVHMSSNKQDEIIEQETICNNLKVQTAVTKQKGRKRTMSDTENIKCLCESCNSATSNPCLKCGKLCTYQPTVNGRPLYRCEWRVLQNGPNGRKEREFKMQLAWLWTCSVCGMEPLDNKEN